MGVILADQLLYRKAWIFASNKHKLQLYPGSEKLPYVTHIGSVILELFPALQNNELFDVDIAVCCALLHDTVEDTDTTICEIEEHFGEKIAAGVLALTKDKALQGKEAISDSLERIKKQPREIWIVKLADRTANLRAYPDHWSAGKCLAYAQESERILDALGEASPVIANSLAS